MGQYQLKDHHPTAWISEMNGREKSTFLACAGGWALDAMDFWMFTLAMPAITRSLRLSDPQAAFIVTATLLASAFGGWCAGALSDRFGRVLTLQITIGWFAGFAFLCAFAWDYWPLLVLRALMGLGFGGEWAAAAVLVGETIRRPEHRGKALGALQSFWAIGWGGAVAIYTLLFSVLSPENGFSKDLAWRALFFVSLTPAVLVFYVRRLAEEPEIIKNARADLAKAGRTVNFLAIFRRDMLKTTFLTSLLSTGAQGGYYVIATWLPTYLQRTHGLTVAGSGGYLAVVIFGSFMGYLVSAWLCDLIGRRANFILFAACSIATIIVYTLIPMNHTVMLLLGFPLGFFASGIFSGMGPFLSELFPTAMRASGMGFAYNFGRGVGALNPWFAGMLSASLPLGQTIGLLTLIPFGLVVIAALLLRETKGSKLGQPTNDKPDR